MLVWLLLWSQIIVELLHLLEELFILFDGSWISFKLLQIFLIHLIIAFQLLTSSCRLRRPFAFLHSPLGLDKTLVFKLQVYKFGFIVWIFFANFTFRFGVVTTGLVNLCITLISHVLHLIAQINSRNNIIIINSFDMFINSRPMTRLVRTWTWLLRFAKLGISWHVNHLWFVAARTLFT